MASAAVMQVIACQGYMLKVLLKPSVNPSAIQAHAAGIACPDMYCSDCVLSHISSFSDAQIDSCMHVFVTMQSAGIKESRLLYFLMQ